MRFAAARHGVRDANKAGASPRGEFVKVRRTARNRVRFSGLGPPLVEGRAARSRAHRDCLLPGNEGLPFKGEVSC